MKMETNKMRCHFSIIFEKAGSFLIFWVILAFNWINEIIDVLTAPHFSLSALQHILPACLLLALLLLVIIGYQFLVWRKTFLYIEGDTFIIERNTLNRKKTTFSVSSIANINLEQNLFERLLGTSRLKLDTDSFSTANGTDVSIVLSTTKATTLKATLLSLMKKDSVSKEIPSERELSSTDITIPYASVKEVLSHCFFSISTTLLFFTLAIAAGTPLFFYFADISFGDIVLKIQTRFFKGFLGVCFIVIPYASSLIKQLFSFHHFCCFRQKNDLIIRYGFFHKQDFTIPLERINAIQIVQPPLARLTGRFQAKLMCIGIGDSAAEKPQLTLCMKKKDFYVRLQELLPEFSIESALTTHKLPKGTGISYSFSCLLFILLFSAVFWIASFSAANDTTNWSFLGVSYGIALFLILLYQVFHYLSLGTALGEKQLVLHTGAFQKQSWLIPYGKIQFITLHHTPLLRFFHLTKGDINILASFGNNILSLPFISQTEAVKLQKKHLN